MKFKIDVGDGVFEVLDTTGDVNMNMITGICNIGYFPDEATTFIFNLTNDGEKIKLHVMVNDEFEIHSKTFEGDGSSWNKDVNAWMKTLDFEVED